MIDPGLGDDGLVLREDEPLAPRTTLKIGGRARHFAEARTKAGLARLLRLAAEKGLPLLPLGKGSNLLVPDEGFPGVVFVLAGELASWRVEGNRIVAGGGAALPSLAVAARRAGLSGLEPLSGIPSTFGGAIRINAGAYGTELFDLLETVDVVTRTGEARTEPAAAIPHGYRWTAFVERKDLIAGGTLLLRPAPPSEIDARLEEVRERRRTALPPEPNAGSVFKNPAGQFAGKLLEVCGLKGRRVGGAAVSVRHANVIVNTGGATAADVRELMRVMRLEVQARFGIELVPEIEVIRPMTTERRP